LDKTKRMKYIVPIVLLLLSTAANSQGSYGVNDEKNKVSPAIVAPPTDFKSYPSVYKGSARQWRKICIQSPDQSKSWLEYYKAEKYAVMNSRKKVSNHKQVHLDSIVTAAQKHINGTYEMNYILGLNTKDPKEAGIFYEKAYQLSSNNIEILDEMAGYYEITGQTKKKNSILNAISKIGKYSNYKLEYAYNLLLSLPASSVLVTNGEADTYPLWVMQSVKRFRRDVTVINLDLITHEPYRKKMMSQLKMTDPGTSEAEQFISKLYINNPTKYIALSLTLPVNILKVFQNNLYLSGTAFIVRGEAVNNKLMLENTYANLRLLNIKSINKSKGDKKLGKNYLMMLSNLYSSYKNTNLIKANEVKNLAKIIAEENDLWLEIKHKFN